jgi:outer membrane protein assembly factor BamB
MIMSSWRPRAALLASALLFGCSMASGTGPVHPTAARAALPAACPAPVAFGSLPTFAHVNGADDVTVGQDGNVWITNVTGNQITELNARGGLVRTFADTRNPEGMVQLPTGQFALAEQSADRVVVFDPVRNTKQVWVRLTANGNLGVDGLGIEPGMLLLPDSAQGKLDTVPLPPFSGGPKVVASNLGRPVAATPVGDGTILVAVENQPGLDRVNPSTGQVTGIGNFGSLDEVLVKNGVAYVADLSTGQLDAVNLAGSAVSVLVTGVGAPQGLTFRSDGSLLLVDENSGNVAVATACG